ncbi:hypothetical protein CTP10_R66880 (plasmid) [Cupriavidus sp. P-10]|nr:hypothetical protein [Cupriavidus sp. P-10]BDB29274.1 hypothetical protein CTP10_R66880 [Cupriavidus sp. P-10]
MPPTFSTADSQREGSCQRLSTLKINDLRIFYQKSSLCASQYGGEIELPRGKQNFALCIGAAAIEDKRSVRRVNLQQLRGNSVATVYAYCHLTTEPSEILEHETN